MTNHCLFRKEDITGWHNDETTIGHMKPALRISRLEKNKRAKTEVLIRAKANRPRVLLVATACHARRADHNKWRNLKGCLKVREAKEARPVDHVLVSYRQAVRYGKAALDLSVWWCR
jgi:hypothetical protein